MRILMVNKFWYERGGLERVMFDEIRWLESAGHDVAHFSTRHPLNRPSIWEDHFAPYLELGDGTSLARGRKMLAAGRMFWNGEAARRFDRLLLEFKPDVVHAHGIHRQISPSVVYAARRRGVPVVQTVHDGHLSCPADVLLRPDGTACRPPLCSAADARSAVALRCIRDSRAASAVATAEFLWREGILRYESALRALVFPSSFLARLWVGERAASHVPVHVVPNAARVQECGPPGGYMLFVGTLSHAKGFHVLLDAAHGSGVKVVVAGDGPLASDARTERNGEVDYVGHVSFEAVPRLIEGSMAVIVPSLCQENAPLAVIQGMACGRPIIASRVGGVAELARDGREGLLVEPGDAGMLRAAMTYLAARPAEAAAMGRRAQTRAARHFSPERHLGQLLAIYSRAAAMPGTERQA